MEKRELIRKEILYYIEKNSRANLGELAVLLGTDEVTVANEIAEMEKDKVICGYHTLIDWDKAGVELVTALIEVRMTPQRSQGFDKIAERICNYPEVHAVYLISGGYDLLVSLEGKTLKEVSQFVSEKLSTLDSVISTATHFILIFVLFDIAYMFADFVNCFLFSFIENNFIFFKQISSVCIDRYDQRSKFFYAAMP